MKRRIVITGLGAVTPLGMGAASLHERWAAGDCGIADGVGACQDFEPADHFSIKEVRRLDRFSQLALVASAEALAQAGWDSGLPYDPMRTGCVIATGIGGIETVEIQHDVMRDKGPKKRLPARHPPVHAERRGGRRGDEARARARCTASSRRARVAATRSARRCG